MKIAINARVLNERRGGPARYTYNIIKELARIDKKNTYHILMYDEVEFDFELPDNFIIKIFKSKSRILFDYLSLPLFSYLNKIDFFIFPKNTFSPFIRGKKIPFFNDIVYFEDFDFREFKFFDNLHHTIMIPIAGKLSYTNLSISDFTASRMTELLKIKKEKIKIIKLGIEDKFRVIKSKPELNIVIKKYNLKLPFFFYAGSLSPRKNIINVIKAFAKIKDTINHNIYVTGGDSWRDADVFKLINENNLQERFIQLGFLSDEELIVMYNLAECYLYPSIYEGFGLPILEAQSCGCPVITSNVSSCPEIAGDSALLVDPYNINEISEAMLKVIKDKNIKNSLVSKGFENCKKYSWEKTTKDFLKAINGD